MGLAAEITVENYTPEAVFLKAEEIAEIMNLALSLIPNRFILTRAKRTNGIMG